MVTLRYEPGEDGQPLAAVYNSVEEALAQGAYDELTGRGKVRDVVEGVWEPNAEYERVSPHTYELRDKLDPEQQECIAGRPEIEEAMKDLSQDDLSGAGYDPREGPPPGLQDHIVEVAGVSR